MTSTLSNSISNVNLKMLLQEQSSEHQQQHQHQQHQHQITIRPLHLGANSAKSYTSTSTALLALKPDGSQTSRRSNATEATAGSDTSSTVSSSSSNSSVSTSTCGGIGSSTRERAPSASSTSRQHTTSTTTSSLLYHASSASDTEVSLADNQETDSDSAMRIPVERVSMSKLVAASSSGSCTATAATGTSTTSTLPASTVQPAHEDTQQQQQPRSTFTRLNTPQSFARRRKSVHFTTVEVRWYPIMLGDHPSCSSGPPLTLDWKHLKSKAFNVTEFEASRSKNRRVTSSCSSFNRYTCSRSYVERQLKLSSEYRQALLLRCTTASEAPVRDLSHASTTVDAVTQSSQTKSALTSADADAGSYESRDAFLADARRENNNNDAQQDNTCNNCPSRRSSAPIPRYTQEDLDDAVKDVRRIRRERRQTLRRQHYLWFWQPVELALESIRRKSNRRSQLSKYRSDCPKRQREGL